MVADVDKRTAKLVKIAYQLHAVCTHCAHRLICRVICHLGEYKVMNMLGLSAHKRQKRAALKPGWLFDAQHVANGGEYIHLRYHCIGRAAPDIRVAYEHGNAGAGIAQSAFHVGE